MITAASQSVTTGNAALLAFLGVVVGAVLAWFGNTIIGHNKNRREDGEAAFAATVQLTLSAAQLLRTQLPSQLIMTRLTQDAGSTSEAQTNKTPKLDPYDGIDDAAFRLFLLRPQCLTLIQQMRRDVQSSTQPDRSGILTFAEIDNLLFVFLNNVRRLLPIPVLGRSRNVPGTDLGRDKV